MEKNKNEGSLGRLHILVAWVTLSDGFAGITIRISESETPVAS